MSQRHLYGTNYVQMSPPAEWEAISVEATVNDSTFEATIDTNTFTFVGDVATYITNTWIPSYGVFNGLPYRIEIFEGGTIEVVFDGFIVLSEKEHQSITGPNVVVAPVQSLNNNISVIDKASIITQGVLFSQGWIVPSDFVDVPIVKVSKKNIQDRTVAITGLAYTIANSFFSAIQNFLSAISDILGLSAPLGLVELASLFFSLYVEIQQLQQLIKTNKDLLLASQTFYKGIGVKTVLVRAFQKLGYTVDFGIIDARLEKEYVKGSSYGDLGSIMPGLPGVGILNSGDYGYSIAEMLQIVEVKYNTRVDVRNGVVHIKTKSDPFWTTSPVYQPDDLVVETTKQYTNGTYRDKTEDVFATEITSYEFDASDAWTLTERSGDAHEIHRELINELNPKMNTMKGLKDNKVPWAMAVRYEPIESLIQLMSDSFTDFGGWLTRLQDVLTNYASYIDAAAGAGNGVSSVLNSPILNFFFTVQAGGLKVEDDTWALPKSIYADNVGGVLNIPANFKDFIGAKAIYDDWYLPESPAIENNFEGQYKKIDGLTIRFGLSEYIATKTNPYFILNTNNAKFTFIGWNENDRNSQTNIEFQEPFDENIKETEI